MSAAEVIEMIKKLPPTEQAEVRVFMAATGPTENAQPAAISNEAFERATTRVFAENKELLRRLAQ